MSKMRKGEEVDGSRVMGGCWKTDISGGIGTAFYGAVGGQEGHCGSLQIKLS